MLVQQPALPSVGYVEIQGMYQRAFYSDIIRPKATAGGVVTMGMLYDVLYRGAGQKNDQSHYCVCWRYPERERSLRADSAYGISEYGIIEDYPDEVGIVLVRHAKPLERGQGDTLHSINSLEQEYRPADLELYNPKLVCMGAEDWFG